MDSLERESQRKNKAWRPRQSAGYKIEKTWEKTISVITENERVFVKHATGRGFVSTDDSAMVVVGVVTIFAGTVKHGDLVDCVTPVSGQFE